MKKQLIPVRKTYPKDIDPKIEVWCDEFDTYLTYSVEEVIKVIKENTGNDEKDIREELTKVSRSEWENKYVTNSEDPYESKYTFADMICKIIDEGWNGKPDLFCTTEY